MRRALWSALALVIVASTGCVDIPPDPLELDGGILTVDNRTSSDWQDVEIWINQYFRVAVPKIAAKSRFQVPLNAFVSGYAQRFDIHHAVIKDLRLAAKQPDGTPVALKKDMRSGLAALGRKE
jgi:hypothetical protein